MELTYQPFYQSSWALVVGINSYQHVSPLSYACNDADAISKLLISEFEFPTENVFVLKDNKATKQAIMDRFLRFSDKANNPDDRLLVFFAGHGLTLDGLRGPIGYLVPVDGDPANKNSLIRWDDLTRNAEFIQARHILFIIDACYSGLALQRAIAPGTQRFLSDMLQRLSRQVITAGKADEVVADGGGSQGKNSIFTGYLLEGLKGAALDSNGVMTANEIMAYVYKKVGQDSHSEQTPHYGHLEGDGDFVFKTPQREHLGAITEKDYLIETKAEETGFIADQIIPTSKPSFLIKNGYRDPTNPNFGRNDWTNRLGESRRGKEFSSELSKAFSWTSVVFEPTTNLQQQIDNSSLSEKFKNYKIEGQNHYEHLKIPSSIMTTIDSVVLFNEITRENKIWDSYIRIDKKGNIELTDTKYTFEEIEGVRCFFYVQLIGFIWQSLFFAKHVLLSSGYRSGVKAWINLVGTLNSILVDFAKEPGENNQHWRTPFERDAFFDSGNLFGLQCSDPNIQMEFQFDVEKLDESKSFEIIKNIAINLSLAYNHQSTPRCFNYNTDVFPWKQYLNQRQW